MGHLTGCSLEGMSGPALADRTGKAGGWPQGPPRQSRTRSLGPKVGKGITCEGTQPDQKWEETRSHELKNPGTSTHRLSASQTFGTLWVDAGIASPAPRGVEGGESRKRVPSPCKIKAK